MAIVQWCNFGEASRGDHLPSDWVQGKQRSGAQLLSSELDESLRRFLADPKKGARIDRTSNTLYLSRIFDWFSEDFEAAGGVLSTVGRHGPPEIRQWLSRRTSGPLIRYFDYNWDLNDSARKPSVR